jgi:hypothetical protein
MQHRLRAGQPLERLYRDARLELAQANVAVAQLADDRQVLRRRRPWAAVR